MLRTGEILQGRYQIDSKIGHNIAHQVWLAKDITTQSNELVVVKVLLAGEVTQWDEFRLFEREAKILKQLKHPQIPKYLDYFPLNEPIKGFVLVQEYIRGESLKNILLQEKRFTESEIRQIATNILHILIYLHEFNPPVLHRDIKPSNLIWGEDGYIYLIDFGAVQYRTAVEGSTFTVVGTYGYTPIEQFGGRTVPSSDIYALGATLIHLLTGIAPADLPQEDFKIQFADRVKLNPDFLRWLGKTIEPDIKKRFDTARNALQALRSGIAVNHNKNDISINFNQDTYDLTELVPSETNVEIEKSPYKLIIKYTDILITDFFAIGFSFLLGTIAIISLSSYLLFIICMLLTMITLICTYIFGTLTPINLHFYNNKFEIYRYRNIGYSMKILDKGFTEDIEDVVLSNLYDEDDVRKEYYISIKTKQKEYVFGKGLNQQECIWLVEEIKSWLKQKQS